MKRLALLLLLLVSLTAFAQEKPVVISGLVFGDYYNVASHHDPNVEGMNGFWIRRAFLTFDRTFSDQLSARLRFELNQPGDFRTNANTEPFLKDAWARWRQSPALEIMIGLTPSPAVETAERVWGYRSVERTPLDLHRLIATRDLGIVVMGAPGRLRYHVQVGNGTNAGAETNEGKKVSASFGILPTKATVLELYADHDDRPGDTDRTTMHALAAITTDRYRAGVHVGRQMRDNSDDINLASIFGVWNLTPKYSLLGRIDRTDPNPEGASIAYLPFDPTRESTLFIAGVDWKLHKNLSIIPNLEYVQYDDGGDDTLMPRVTFFFTF